MPRSEEVKQDLQRLADAKQAIVLQRFFKTGKGEYGEGDVFIGIKVPVQRKVAKKFKGLALADLGILLNSKVHEHRLTGLFILVDSFEKSKKEENKARMKEIVDFYLANTRNVNNWDLVDLSAPKVLGEWLVGKDKRVLHELVESKNLWEKRIAMLACHAFIKRGEFKDAIAIAELLLKDKHDLIHKAVGWMLREIGKKNQAIEEEFLKKHSRKMPRTMLRYAIEKFPEQKRKAYLNGTT